MKRKQSGKRTSHTGSTLESALRKDRLLGDARSVGTHRVTACRDGQSVEPLSARPKKSFAEALAAMPNVGEDRDFERINE
jgi:hypothetical protein